MLELNAADIEEAGRSGGLDLSDRRLTELPPEIGQLTRLQTPQLNDNGLRS